MHIGMGESKEFAGELFDALARRRKICTENGITKEELRMFWEDMTKRDLDNRLEIFFDMYVYVSLPLFLFICRSA